MKTNRILRLILTFLIVVAVAAISFMGIFIKDKNSFSNVVKDYKLGMDLSGSRKVELVVSDSKTTINYDADGNKIATDDTTTEVANTEEKPVNSEEVLNKKSYVESKKIIEKRLEDMGVNEYEIRLNETNGQMIINIPEDDITDTVVSQLQYQGKFEIVDKETDEVLMTNDDLESVVAGYGSTNNSSTTVVYININFNKEGTAKFRDITNTYIETEVPAEKSENTNTEYSGEEVVSEDATKADTEESSTKTETKEITIKVDDSALLTTHFDKEIANGILQLSVGSSSSQSAEELQDSYLRAINLAALLNNGPVPVVYKDVSQGGEYVISEITNQNIAFFICLFIVVALISMIYIIIRYKDNGLFVPAYLILHMAILLLLIRYTNVVLTVSGITAIAVSYALGYIVAINRLNNYEKIDDKKQAYKKSMLQTLLILVPIFIIAIVFTFNSWQPVASFGMVTFWGTLVSLLYMI